VIHLCFSNNFIEQRAYEMSEDIRKNSLYKFVRVDISGDNSLELQKQNDHWNGSALITKVILEDKKGKLYSVEPNLNGISFAQGEITYREYRQLQKKESLNAWICFIGIVVFFGISMFTLMKYLT